MSDYELQTDAVEGCIPIIASVHRHEDSYDGNCDSQEYINQYKVIETIGCGERYHSFTDDTNFDGLQILT
jgi:hypothetical protein